MCLRSQFHCAIGVIIALLILATACSKDPGEERETQPTHAPQAVDDLPIDPRLLAEIESYADKWAGTYTEVIIADFFDDSGECLVRLAEDAYYQRRDLAAYFVLDQLLVTLYDHDSSCFTRFVTDRFRIGDLADYVAIEDADVGPTHPVFRILRFEATRGNFFIVREGLSA